MMLLYQISVDKDLSLERRNFLIPFYLAARRMSGKHVSEVQAIADPTWIDNDVILGQLHGVMQS